MLKALKRGRRTLKARFKARGAVPCRLDCTRPIGCPVNLEIRLLTEAVFVSGF